ncbi:MAG TPA: BamA/TamA family outer membrane protein [Acidobacteriota bacterium]|nr:BamA/TamA family outer membrane protein [Acidobacteriota bacterium]
MADDSGELSFEGVESIPYQELISHLKEKGFDPQAPQALSERDWERGERLLRHYYQDQGFPLARVERTTTGRAGFRIIEGPRAELGWVDFQGNQFFSGDELARVLDVSGRLDFNRLEERLEKVREHYRDAGFPLATVERASLQVQETRERSFFPLPFQSVSRLRIRLKIEVEEGGRFRFGRWDCPQELSALQLPQPVEGEFYSERLLLEFRARAGKHFASQGRLIRELQILQRFDQDALEVDHRVVFSLYPPLDVRFIRLQGHHNYPDRFYRRELRLEESRPFDPRLLARSLSNLNSTGVLKRPLTDQDVELVIHEPQAMVDVVISLEEKKPRGFFYSLSRNDLGGLQVGLVFTLANWLGLGEELGLNVEHGGGTTGAALGIASRYLLGTDVPLRFALRFFRRHTGFRLSGVDERVEDVFRSKETGFTGLAAYRVRHGQETGSEYSLSWLQRPQQEPARRVVLRPFWTWGREDELVGGQSLKVSSRFSFFDDPSQAWNWSPRLEYRREGREEPLQRGFAFRFQAQYSHFGSGSQLLSERLFTDSDTARGFSGTTSGPWRREKEGLRPLGGDALLGLNSEYQVPLTRNVSVSPFFDTAINFSTRSPQGFRVVESTNRILRASLGSELRVDLPAQLPQLRLIAAWNPLRMQDVLSQGPSGLARLRDPRASLRLAFDPVF